MHINVEEGLHCSMNTIVPGEYRAQNILGMRKKKVLGIKQKLLSGLVQNNGESTPGKFP